MFNPNHVIGCVSSSMALSHALRSFWFSRKTEHRHIRGAKKLVLPPVFYFLEYPLISNTVRVNTFYFTIMRRYGIVRTSAPAEFNVAAFLTILIHIILKLEHFLPCIGLCKIFHAGMIFHIAHNIFRHAYETIAWIYAPIRTHRKGISHTINEGTYSAPACEHAFTQVVYIHDLDLAHVFQVLIQEINQQFPILFRGKCKSFRGFITD